MLEHIKSLPNWFCKLISASMDLKHPKAWRAAMIIGHIMKKNDPRATPHINDFIDCLPHFCLLYTSPSPRDKRQSRMPSSA